MTVDQTDAIRTDGGDWEKDEYRITSDWERAMLSQCDRVESIIPMVCDHGHVHLVFGEEWLQISLTPDQAEKWVEVLYDAAQEAKEADGQ